MTTTNESVIAGLGLDAPYVKGRQSRAVIRKLFAAIPKADTACRVLVDLAEHIENDTQLCGLESKAEQKEKLTSRMGQTDLLLYLLTQLGAAWREEDAREAGA